MSSEPGPVREPEREAAARSPERPPAPLDYHRPEQPASSGAVAVLGALLGFGLAGLLTGFLGCGIFVGGNYPLETKADHFSVAPVLVFAALVGGGIAGMFFLLRGERKRPFLLGFACGTLVIGLIEGLCFMNA